MRLEEICPVIGEMPITMCKPLCYGAIGKSILTLVLKDFVGITELTLMFNIDVEIFELWLNSIGWSRDGL